MENLKTDLTPAGRGGLVGEGSVHLFHKEQDLKHPRTLKAETRAKVIQSSTIPVTIPFMLRH